MILINDFGSVTYENFHANHIHTRHLLLDTSKYDDVEIIIGFHESVKQVKDEHEVLGIAEEDKYFLR